MKKHPHAAALLRARGVLPSASEHVAKPEFDRVHSRPIRETAHPVYDEDDYGEGEMPSWEVISQGNPALAEALHHVADTLSMTKSQSLAHRQKILKGLVTDWHPDRHTASGDQEIATKVFQWLQVVKTWYLQESTGPEMEQQPLPGYDDPDRPVAPTDAQQYLHPSGSVFSVW
uniref:J domain-containing protein n=1 Tax=Alexandrium catenella TaxID=2925 RepID=A0A7S1WYD6_ALECA|mmetsp:Transcript_99640/g.264820  ORF Transcript_99640/g.264820 Transcript_99640/m.264820 type:complete len:173 (+) Transcript_99640:2-520(+)